MPTLRFWLLGTCRGASGGRTRNRRPVDLNTAPFTDLSRCSLRQGAKSSSPHAQILSVPKGKNQGKAIGVRYHPHVWVDIIRSTTPPRLRGWAVNNFRACLQDAPTP